LSYLQATLPVKTRIPLLQPVDGEFHVFRRGKNIRERKGTRREGRKGGVPLHRLGGSVIIP